MKKLIAIVLAVTLLTIGLAVPASAQIGDIVSITKSFDVDSAGLCDHVTGDIVVETSAAGVVVTDDMPDGLALVDVTVTATGGGGYDLDFEEDMLEVTLNDADEYTISFEVQVTDVLSYDSFFVTNEAIATDDEANTDSASDDLELLPYYDFYKSYAGAWYWDVDQWVYIPQDAIPVGTDVHFWMYIDLYNSLSVDMLDVVVKDNLGGDLEIDSWYIWAHPDLADGYLDITPDAGVVTVTGKTEKVHLNWEAGEIDSGEGFYSDLEVSTDINTGTGNGKKGGHQEYTDEVDTVHELNSGATLKFTASDTGFKCSVGTEPVEIETVVPTP
jgi:hypothetical protein